MREDTSQEDTDWAQPITTRTHLETLRGRLSSFGGRPIQSGTAFQAAEERVRIEIQEFRNQTRAGDMSGRPQRTQRPNPRYQPFTVPRQRAPVRDQDHQDETFPDGWLPIPGLGQSRNRSRTQAAATAVRSSAPPAAARSTSSAPAPSQRPEPGSMNRGSTAAAGTSSNSVPGVPSARPGVPLISPEVAPSTSRSAPSTNNRPSQARDGLSDLEDSEEEASASNERSRPRAVFEWNRTMTGTCKPLIVLALTEFEQMLLSRRLPPNETSVVHFTRSFHARYPQLGVDLKTFHRKFRDGWKSWKKMKRRFLEAALQSEVNDIIERINNSEGDLEEDDALRLGAARRHEATVRLPVPVPVHQRGDTRSQSQTQDVSQNPATEVGVLHHLTGNRQVTRTSGSTTGTPAVRLLGASLGAAIGEVQTRTAENFTSRVEQHRGENLALLTSQQQQQARDREDRLREDRLERERRERRDLEESRRSQMLMCSLVASLRGSGPPPPTVPAVRTLKVSKPWNPEADSQDPSQIIPLGDLPSVITELCGYLNINEADINGVILKIGDDKTIISSSEAIVCSEAEVTCKYYEIWPRHMNLPDLMQK